MALSGSLMVAPLFSRILARFPQQFTFCFAYGSGVKKQLTAKNKPPERNMIDFIFCVDNPYRWHEANLKMNPQHYSNLKYLGHKFIAKFQENVAAKIYFNTLVNLEGVTIKYGVISNKDLITDLLDWCDIYIAGRLHKPVEIIKYSNNAELQTALQLNLQSAVHAALLMLPETFSEYEFYYTISNISYSGDFRMTFGETKNKIESIVKPQLDGFRNLYFPVIKTMKEYIDFPFVTSPAKSGVTSQDGKTPEMSPTASEIDRSQYFVNCSQDVHPLTKLYHLNQLPKCPQRAIVRFWNKGTVRQDTEDALRAIANDPDCDEVVKECIKRIVWNSSVKQSLKGVLTAGLTKSIVYSGKKIAKMIRNRDVPPPSISRIKSDL